MPFSIRDTLAGRHVLLTGASGFVGKVWLAMVLEFLPEIGRVYVLVRGKGRDPHERFERIIGTSPAFRPLHAKFGDDLPRYLAERVEVVDGDLSQPKLGIDPRIRRRLQRNVDIAINFAGLVDFNPDLRDAMASNVDGTMSLHELLRGSDKARLLHISTCYVGGARQGTIAERPVREFTPNGRRLDPEAEYRAVHAEIERLHDEHHGADNQADLHRQVIDRIHERGYEETDRRISSMVRLLGRRQLKAVMTEEGTRRSRELGWQNTYCYTKALAEALIEARGGVEHAVLRPAIVESSMRNPFPGWNEGFNTCGPLAYLAGTWFRHLPAKTGNPLDIIPVDQVCQAVTIVAAALLRGEHAPVYQIGTSDRNVVTVDRIADLSALDHRKHLRKRGATPVRRLVLSRWDITPSDPEHVLNVGNVRRVMRQLTRFLRKGLPEKIPSELREKADDVARTSETAERKLRQIDELLDLFLPFIHDNYSVFECRAIERHVVREPQWQFRPETIEWRSYWLDVEMPGLRKWCFPTYEGEDAKLDEREIDFKFARVDEFERTTGPAANEEVG